MVSLSTTAGQAVVRQLVLGLMLKPCHGPHYGARGCEPPQGGLADVDTDQSQVGEVGNAALHAVLEEPNRCGFISALEGFKSVCNRCEVLQLPSDQYPVLRGVNQSRANSRQHL